MCGAPLFQPLSTAHRTHFAVCGLCVHSSTSTIHCDAHQAHDRRRAATARVHTAGSLRCKGSRPLGDGPVPAICNASSCNFFFLCNEASGQGDPTTTTGTHCGQVDASPAIPAILCRPENRPALQAYSYTQSINLCSDIHCEGDTTNHPTLGSCTGQGYTYNHANEPGREIQWAGRSGCACSGLVSGRASHTEHFCLSTCLPLGSVWPDSRRPTRGACCGALTTMTWCASNDKDDTTTHCRAQLCPTASTTCHHCRPRVDPVDPQPGHPAPGVRAARRASRDAAAAPTSAPRSIRRRALCRKCRAAAATSSGPGVTSSAAPPHAATNRSPGTRSGAASADRPRTVTGSSTSAYLTSKVQSVCEPIAGADEGLCAAAVTPFACQTHPLRCKRRP